MLSAASETAPAWKWRTRSCQDSLASREGASARGRSFSSELGLSTAPPPTTGCSAGLESASSASEMAGMADDSAGRVLPSCECCRGLWPPPLVPGRERRPTLLSPPVLESRVRCSAVGGLTLISIAGMLAGLRPDMDARPVMGERTVPVNWGERAPELGERRPALGERRPAAPGERRPEFRCRLPLERVPAGDRLCAGDRLWPGERRPTGERP